MLGEIGVEALANNSLKKSYISVIVPTVDLGLETVFCSMAITGLNPEMWSTSGFVNFPTN